MKRFVHSTGGSCGGFPPLGSVGSSDLETSHLIVPDTGAEITVVPGCFVYENQLRDERVIVKGWDGMTKHSKQQ